MDQRFIQYPTFVQNQVLSPDNLNQVFDFLDEQERMSRVYLIGTGVAFGFPVQVASDGTTITIGCGAGVTTQGYLIKMDTTTFNQYAQFEFSSTDMYPPLYSPPPPPIQTPYTLYELYNDNSTLNIPGNPSVPPPPGVTPTYLSLAMFTVPMVLVLYYDLNTVQAVNCNTESCDGMGEITTATVKVLLMQASDAQQVINAEGSAGCNTPSASCFYNNIALNIPRFNVPVSSSSQVCSTGDFYAAYIKCFTGTSLLSLMRSAFSTIYSQIFCLVGVNYPTNIFASFDTDYSYLSSASTIISTVGVNGLIQLQYYYDYFVNLIEAYNELNEACLELTANCCPADIYPQHLFIGQISNVNGVAVYSSAAPYFFNFAPSIVQSKYGNETERIISLWGRMDAMRQNFSAPPPSVPNPATNTPGGIIITPTISGPEPLSEKSIPFYYSNFAGTLNPPYNNIAPLVLSNWNYELNVRGQTVRNLSYWSGAYNTDPIVSQPLQFDLEDYNFFRVEGMVGMGSGAAATISSMQANNRLPFDVVVVSTGGCCGSTTQSSISTAIFNDLELAYSTAVAQLTCQFVNIAQRLYIFQANVETHSTTGWTSSKVPFLQIPTFRVLTASIGYAYEYNGKLQNWHSSDQYNTSTAGVPLSSTGYLLSSEQIWNNLMTNYANSGYENEFLYGAYYLAAGGAACEPIYMMQYILNPLQQGLSSMASGGITTFNSVWADLVNTCYYWLDYIDLYENWLANNDPGVPVSPILDLVKMTYTEIITFCTASVIQEIVAEYDSRITAYSNANLLSCFISQNPGIQHRAGVPVGGTLVLVEHVPVNPSNINTSTPGGTIDAVIATRADSFKTGMIIGDFFTTGCPACIVGGSTTNVNNVSSGSNSWSASNNWSVAPYLSLDNPTYVVPVGPNDNTYSQ